MVDAAYLDILVVCLGLFGLAWGVILTAVALTLRLYHILPSENIPPIGLPGYETMARANAGVTVYLQPFQLTTGVYIPPEFRMPIRPSNTADTNENIHIEPDVVPRDTQNVQKLIEFIKESRAS